MINKFGNATGLLTTQLCNLGTVNATTRYFALIRSSRHSTFRSRVRTLNGGAALLISACGVRRTIGATIRITNPRLNNIHVSSNSLTTVTRHIHGRLSTLNTAGAAVAIAGSLSRCTLTTLRATPISSCNINAVLIANSNTPAYTVICGLARHRNTSNAVIPIVGGSGSGTAIPNHGLTFHSCRCTLTRTRRIVSNSRRGLTNFAPRPA